MLEKLNTIAILVLAITYTLLRIISYKKTRQSKYDGVEKISRDIERLESEKISEQKRVVRERSDILYSEFSKVFYTCMSLSEDSKPAQYYNSLILSPVRKKTDDIMNDVIYINNIAKREGIVWTNYKNQKFAFILTEIINYIKEIFKEDLIGYSHKEVVSKCRDDIVRTYYSHIDPMFEEIKSISVEYKNRIKDQERVLADLKNGNKKKK